MLSHTILNISPRDNGIDIYIYIIYIDIFTISCHVLRSYVSKEMTAVVGEGPGTPHQATTAAMDVSIAQRVKRSLCIISIVKVHLKLKSYFPLSDSIYKMVAIEKGGSLDWTT